MSTDTRAALEEALHDEAGRLMLASRQGIHLAPSEAADLVRLLTQAAALLARSAPEERGEGERYEVYRADNGYWYVYGVRSSGAGRDHRCLTDPEARHLTPDAAWRAALATPPALVEGERDAWLYALTEEVEREWQMSGLSGREKGDELYADFAVEVSKRALASRPVQGSAP